MQTQEGVHGGADPERVLGNRLCKGMVSRKREGKTQRGSCREPARGERGKGLFVERKMPETPHDQCNPDMAFPSKKTPETEHSEMEEPF